MQTYTSIINKIISENLASLDCSDIGLLTGKPGILLLIESYGRCKGVNYSQEFQILLENLIISSNRTSDLTYGSGISGINWLYTYLSKRHVIDGGLLERLCANDSTVMKAAFSALRAGDLDYLFGSTGIMRYFLYKYNDSYRTFFLSYFNELIKIQANQNNIFYAFDRYANSTKFGQIDVGLAHGILGILKLCIDCYSKNVCQDSAKFISDKIINFLLLNKNSDTSIGYYPFIIKLENRATSNCRLAWCYGDTSVGYILYQAGKTFDNRSLTDFSLQLLRHTTKRIDNRKNGVFDAGICHGSSGLVHMYRKIWQATGESIFEEAAEYWMQQTINYLTDVSVESRKYNPMTKAYETDYSLLEGSIGIGLVLNSAISNDSDWDYCLLLN